MTSTGSGPWLFPSPQKGMDSMFNMDKIPVCPLSVFRIIPYYSPWYAISHVQMENQIKTGVVIK
jgi:hypothetical protein